MSKVALLHITGNLTYESDAVALWEAFVGAIDRDEYSGIVAWINSGGGSFCAAQDMVSALVRTGLPSVAVAGELCASAAYYFALGFEQVLARPASLLGGLCSSLEVANYSKAHANWGIARKFYSNGPLKRMLNPYAADLAAGEDQAIQAILTDLDDQFHGFLRERRPAAKYVEEFFDGRLVSGVRAHQVGLVDALGGVSEAANVIARMLQQESVEIETIQADETASAAPPAGLSGELALLLASLR